MQVIEADRLGRVPHSHDRRDRSTSPRPRLAREMGLLGLCRASARWWVQHQRDSLHDQRHLPSAVRATAFAFAAVSHAGPVSAYLASAMPRAGGSYVYASRGLSPYLGFIASFSQWFSLCIAIGVVSCVLVPFLRDIATAAGWPNLPRRSRAGACDPRSACSGRRSTGNLLGDAPAGG
jgi:hypothetical protein